jgi:hypothetical protein
MGGMENSLWVPKIIMATLAAYITAVVAHLEHCGMDDPRRLTHSG